MRKYLLGLFAAIIAALIYSCGGNDNALKQEIEQMMGHEIVLPAELQPTLAGQQIF